MSLFIDIHVLQTVPPSNLNRDDTNSPKTCTYGGVLRSRVSSQCWKRATRKDFGTYLDRSDLGVRTKQVFALLAERIAQRGIPEDEATTLAGSTLKLLGLKTTAKRSRKGEEDAGVQSEYLVFLSNLQLDKLADLAVEHGKDLKAAEAKKAADSAHSVDIALFGRMVADSADLNVEAAVQVAHALSTHQVSPEFDFYTAVDDENAEDETGAGMMGTIEFTSSTLYRYATVDLARLESNLGDPEAAARATEAFVRSFVESMPTGKRTSFGNGTLPNAVVVQARRRPINMSGAFEEPVVLDSGSGFVKGSADKLAQHAQELEVSFAGAPEKSWVTRAGDATEALDALGARMPFDALVADLGQWLRERDGR
ncbi:MAG: type I-E CRISPR-associated protein Cas7/Cse4/CasC [Actinomycetia bacterium]|nr:type I-E CRISPR-associated protein Cas7/Cse4/CasC [Actinomycetes bacterium]